MTEREWHNGRRLVRGAAAAPRRLRDVGKASLAAAALLSVSVPSDAWSYEAVWSVTGLHEEVIAHDCRDCEEEIGIIIACTGNGKPAQMTVNLAASEQGTAGTEAEVTIVIDGDPFTRDARTIDYGMIGFTPTFSLAPDDPLVEALQAGNRGFASFNGRVSQIGLKGSRQALEIFKAHCGWTPGGFAENQQRAEQAGGQLQDQPQPLPVIEGVDQDSPPQAPPPLPKPVVDGLDQDSPQQAPPLPSIQQDSPQQDQSPSPLPSGF